VSESSPVERALEVVVYAPLGVALFARDALPGIAGMFVARGRSEIHNRRKHVAQQVTQAKTIGRFAVRFGGPEVKRRVEDGVATARATAETTLSTLAATRASAPGDRPAPTAPRRPTTVAAATNGHQAARSTPAPKTPAAAAPPVSTLPIPEYDELSASQVVGRLEGLIDGDLETVRAYESAHRNRRTILGKIAQLHK
jgi:cytoskeletal protein RodZ